MRWSTAASADSSVSGSSSALRLLTRPSEPGGLSSARMPMPSAKNIMSNLPRSAMLRAV